MGMSLHARVRSSYRTAKRRVTSGPLRAYLWFLEREADLLADHFDLSIGRRVALWRRGFTSRCAPLYAFEEHGYEPYLSELARVRLFDELNGKHRYLLDDKLAQHWLLSGFPANRPTVFGVVDDGWVHGGGTGRDTRPAAVAVPSLLREHSRLVVKRLRGTGGTGVLVCEHNDGFQIDGESVSESQLCARIDQLSPGIITEYVHQHAYAADLYPNAVNTIRLLTVWDDDSEEVDLLGAVQRIGTDASAPVDNFSAGGLSAAIDTDTGRLGPGVRKAYPDGVERVSTHPDTGSRIEDARVPGWRSLQRVVTRIAEATATVPAVGWDVVLNETGTPVVVEANTSPDVDLFQVHEPLLADPDFARIVDRALS